MTTAYLSIIPGQVYTCYGDTDYHWQDDDAYTPDGNPKCAPVVTVGGRQYIPDNPNDWGDTDKLFDGTNAMDVVFREGANGSIEGPEIVHVWGRCPQRMVYVVSGEGEGPGIRELYTGTLSVRALKSRITRERCGGDRWAHLVVERMGYVNYQDIDDRLIDCIFLS